MKEPYPTQYRPLLFAAVVNMATLKSEGGDNWLSQLKRLRFSWRINTASNRTILPIDDRLELVDYDGPIYLQLSPTKSPSVPRPCRAGPSTEVFRSQPGLPTGSSLHDGRRG